MSRVVNGSPYPGPLCCPAAAIAAALVVTISGPHFCLACSVYVASVGHGWDAVTVTLAMARMMLNNTQKAELFQSQLPS